MFEIYLIVLFVMGILSFSLYGIDKKKAIKNKRRISEKTLLLSSFLFGSIGGLLGMYILRHKTKHWYFVVINVVSLILHVLLGYLILTKFNA